jgi:1-acyl-sn-glycerol-3-phosphate acyltransferase
VVAVSSTNPRPPSTGDHRDDLRWAYATAADLGLPPGERVRDVRREPGLLTLGTTGVFRVAAWAYLKTVHRLSVAGTEHLPASPPAVIIANHTSHLDAPAISVTLPGPLRRAALSLAAGEHFFHTLRKSMISASLLSALPMDRRTIGRHELGHLRHRLEAGHTVLVLFPEGTRSRDGTLLPFKPGLGLLVCQLGVPVIPAWIEGAYAAWPADQRWPRPGKVSLRFGPAIDTRAEACRAGWTQVSQRAHEAVAALRDQA